jgi:arginine deiminase
MTTLYDYGTNLAETVEKVQDLLSEGVDPNDESVQELLEKMVAQEEDWENKAINVGKFLNQLSLDEKQVEAEIERLTKKKKAYPMLSQVCMTYCFGR